MGDVVHRARHVVDPARLVMSQALHDRPRATVELKIMQLIHARVGRGEVQGTVVGGDRHRRRDGAGHQLGPQPGQPMQRLVGGLVLGEQPGHFGEVISELPGNGNNATGPTRSGEV